MVDTGIMLATDAICGQEGKAYAVIDGMVENLFNLKDIDTKVEKQKSEFKAIGRRGTQHRATGWKGTGSATLYYASSLFRKMLIKYIKTGVDTYFDLQIVNDDPGSTIGKQTIVLKRVNIDGGALAILDTESEYLEETIDFTFEDVEMLDEFGKPVEFLA